MSDLVIVHRARTQATLPVPANAAASSVAMSLQDQSFLMWETCRRQIFFSEEMLTQSLQLSSADELYRGLDAEQFLVEVLCGLKSPLLGETEVFGQFKNWWQHLDNPTFKNKFSPRMQQIFSIVKKVREEALCGMGSQSYGSLLRKKITDRSVNLSPDQIPVIDFIGAGQLVEEIVPWIQKKWSYRIFCRNPEKVRETPYGAAALEVLPLQTASPMTAALSSVVVVAAPLRHHDLHMWFAMQPKGARYSVYDFRHDSPAFIPPACIRHYSHLDHFTTEVEGQKQEIQMHIGRAYSRIESWKEEENSRVQIRPFGWDDL